MINEAMKYFGLALDPIHIGAGGYRLGRADDPIIRDPATDVPKIPGTSLAGAVREFYVIDTIEIDDKCQSESDDKEKRKCAEGKAQSIFGDENYKGKLQFYDGHIIFFPVTSIQGTVWITTKEMLEYWFREPKDSTGSKLEFPVKVEDKAYAIKNIDDKARLLNLGWLFLEIENISAGKEIILTEKLDNFLKRIVVVSDKLFSNIINDNLEVRTSVRIDPYTGTATKGALFTYEAIPRGTVLGFEVGSDNYRGGRININEIIQKVSPYFKVLGIGGLGTRGFGRLEIYHVKEQREEEE